MEAVFLGERGALTVMAEEDLFFQSNILLSQLIVKFYLQNELIFQQFYFVFKFPDKIHLVLQNNLVFVIDDWSLSEDPWLLLSGRREQSFIGELRELEKLLLMP